MKSKEKYQVTIGLEIHAQLLTNTKIFSTETYKYGELPNTQISPITLAHPGTLPTINKKAIEYAIMMGLSCKAQINEFNIFARKNYFYPDLPKGYQITQDKTPICHSGTITIQKQDGQEKIVRIKRIHLEEDTGKSIHKQNTTLLDFNRAGAPLIEIVTEPDIETSEEAYLVVLEIRNILRYLGICNGNMEEGSLRCDTNISVKLHHTSVLGKRVEIKNINSTRNVKMAIEYEINRQINTLEQGGTIELETRTYDAIQNITIKTRAKDTLNDYKYFPEPNLRPFIVSQDWITKIQETLPPLPSEMLKKFNTHYQLSIYDAKNLTNDKELAMFFDKLCNITDYYKIAANWVIGPIKSYMNELKVTIDEYPIPMQNIAMLINMLGSKKINFSLAQQKLHPAMVKQPHISPEKLAEELGITEVKLDQLEIKNMIHSIIEKYPEKIAEYKNGKKGILAMFMGELMKATNRRINPKEASQLLEKALES
jgi:aspartyl-tRNA(Asn)/glutamyl-tRNA(Gln) amidotransferase subunit B